MKLIKQTERKYYKYQYSSWTQPVLSANGTMGGSDFACATTSSYYQEPWKAFNGSSTYGSNNCFDCRNSTNGDLVWYNPTTIKISNIQIMNYSSSECIKDYTVQGSDDNSTWVDIETGTNTDSSQQGVWDIDLSNNNSAYRYHRILVTSAYTTNRWQVCTITITAQERTSVESTAEDYDYYVDTYKYYKIEEIVRHYYKYVDTTFSQPTLTSNGTVGGDNFAVTGSGTHSSEVYLAFDGNSSTYWDSYNNSYEYAIIYNPNPIKISNIAFNRRYYNGNWTVSGSNDNSTWTELASGTTTALTGNYAVNSSAYYKYYRIECWFNSQPYSLTITGVVRTPIESTVSDYDYYVDKTEYFGVSDD